jgi:hypothetical protein
VGELYAFLATMKLGVFLERDGILNKVRLERQHQVSPVTLEEFKINPEAVPLLKKLKASREYREVICPDASWTACTTPCGGRCPWTTFSSARTMRRTDAPAENPRPVC